MPGARCQSVSTTPEDSRGLRDIAVHERIPASPPTLSISRVFPAGILRIVLMRVTLRHAVGPLVVGTLLTLTCPVSARGQVSTASSQSASKPQPDSSGDDRLATPTGNEVNVSIGRYNYTEPGGRASRSTAPKVGGEYAGTVSLNRRRHWFTEADVRGTFGNVTYAGWCSPLLITPNSASPNGYELDIGDPSRAARPATGLVCGGAGPGRQGPHR